ncbi:MAG: hypothetical protein JNG88_16295 [Phycisphaerales bacterium]|nr:hypothetical protein [Phycisphaerales bacterium]
MYESALFAKCREYVERRCATWYILSSKYGLVRPTDVIAPYDDTLNTKTSAERLQWADGVWARLQPIVKKGDRLVVLAGEKYRQHLVPRLLQHGCSVDIPLNGLRIGEQLQWLSRNLSGPNRAQDVERFYDGIARLDAGMGGARLVSESKAALGWASRGIYLFFEPGENRSRKGSRVVRVGTHGVSQGSKATLWNRLRTHRGTGDGRGNHRTSVFRRHVGEALVARDASLVVPSWGVGQSSNSALRKQEERLEKAVSEHIGAMRVLWLSIGDEPGPRSDRAYIERNAIGLLSRSMGGLDRPSPSWLGSHSPTEAIRNSGLWNVDFIDYGYDARFLDVLETYIGITIKREPPPSASIAPDDW